MEQYSSCNNREEWTDKWTNVHTSMTTLVPGGSGFRCGVHLMEELSCYAPTLESYIAISKVSIYAKAYSINDWSIVRVWISSRVRIGFISLLSKWNFRLLVIIKIGVEERIQNVPWEHVRPFLNPNEIRWSRLRSGRSEDCYAADKVLHALKGWTLKQRTSYRAQRLATVPSRE